MNRSIQSILVPTDGSEGAEQGERRGVELAATLDAELHLLSVVDTRELAPATTDSVGDTGAGNVDLLQQRADEALAAAEGRARQRFAGEVTTVVEDGTPFRAITAYADENDIDLVVMGTHGRSGIERVLLGSVAEKTLRTANVPVLTVPPGAGVGDVDEIRYDDVLVPTDGSQGAEVAVDWGLTLASVYGATVHTLYSVDTGQFPEAAQVGDLLEDLERSGHRALDTVRERAKEADLDVTAHLGNGPPARMIRSYCEDHDVDLVVMGTHGRTGVERVLLGSVTEAVVRDATVPVCCVPMTEE